MDCSITVLASRLPYDVLSRIFAESARVATQQNWGGMLFNWQSNEDTARLSLVCRNWTLPAQHVLYKSCSLLSRGSAIAFVKTLEERTDLAAKVQYLVVGLSEDETWPSSDDDRVVVIDGTTGVAGFATGVVGRSQGETSAAMIAALRVCSNLRHFHVRPLHDSARDGLLAALKLTNLETLICSPRLRKPTVEWTGCMFQREDIAALALPSLKNFELDAWSISLPMTPGGTEIHPDTIEVPVAPSKIVNLRLRFDTSDEHLFALLTAAGPTLEVADIYMERMVAAEGAALAISTALASLKDFRWTTNPPVEGFGDIHLSRRPLIDRVLPHFKVLERLSISATDVSPAILSLLPSSIVDLEVQAYTYRGPFKFEEQMLMTLDDRNVTFKNLKRFTVCDSEEVWSDANVALMTGSCATRGIVFKFIPDEEGDTDSG